MSKRYIGGLISAFNSLKVANAPTIGSATAGNQKACVAFTAPSCVGGGAITSYIAVSNPGFKTGTGTTSPITVSCLTACTAYTFTVSANNAYGPSAFSAASGSATPFTTGTVGIFALGYVSGCLSTTRDKYTFSGCVVSSGAAASVASCSGSAAGNANVGIFALGRSPSASTTRNKYTYSGCVNASATAASAASYAGSAAGNATVGIFALGLAPSASTTRNKYTYSGCVVSSGAAASAASFRGSAASNGTTGVNV